uniref:Uncharacterized protein n=1 Tax=Oryza meridionalis TaxID=40149 RepID=A0A0E0C7Y0_9ORYZ
MTSESMASLEQEATDSSESGARRGGDMPATVQESVQSFLGAVRDKITGPSGGGATAKAKGFAADKTGGHAVRARRLGDGEERREERIHVTARR